MPGGRPRLIESPQEMQEGVDSYFSECETLKKAPTMAGLCYSLGFTDRHAMAEYEDREEFSATVKNARLRIEVDRSERLISKDTFTPGVIFDLKNNHGWKDKSEHELTGKDGEPLHDSVADAARIASMLEAARTRKDNAD